MEELVAMYQKRGSIESATERLLFGATGDTGDSNIEEYVSA
jgi:hypothetical protein